jgi:hypothetical protein
MGLSSYQNESGHHDIVEWPLSKRTTLRRESGVFGDDDPATRMAKAGLTCLAFWNHALKVFHDCLKAADKLPKVVMVAVMRRMITALNAMVRDDAVWADRHSGRHSVTAAR